MSCKACAERRKKMLAWLRAARTRRKPAPAPAPAPASPKVAS